MEAPLYTAVVILGPVLLAAVVLWATLRNRTSRRQDAETEAATRRMYREQSAEDDSNA